MSGLPTGTVSLLFSDIEGSTLLLHRLGSRYAEALDGQREVLRAAWAAHDGHELGTEGDSFFVVFPSADGAVGAAVQAQLGLAGHAWPAGERVRVRMGIHTGSPQLHQGNYLGMDVHRAARIAASAHGGQVVVSSVTAGLARRLLPGGVGLRDLGSHRLRDIPAAEHLFQLEIDGLPADFPALKTIGAATNLPVPATTLVGREAEVAELTALMASGTRLVTLTGAGGSGKTRLAIAVAQGLVASFADGVFFVPLAAVTSADVMWTSIAEVLAVPPNAHMPPRLFTHVEQRRALLVLDNLEQLPDADAVVGQLLDAAPQLAVIASSRRALALPAEHRRPVPPLALPAGATLAQAEIAGAVQLFLERARSVRPDFRLTPDNIDAVVTICRRVDGLPLGIELSAARMRLLSPQALLRRLDDALDVEAISRQAPSRQRTLRVTIACSYELLTPAQQAFCRRLSVFAGGADLAAVAAVTAVPADPSTGADAFDTVAELVDASLVAITDGPDGEPRVSMLETIRAFGLDELRSTGEAGAVRSAHAAHYLHLAQRLAALRESDYLVARRLAETELDNFREALGWALDPEAETTVGAGGEWIGPHLCSALGWFWFMGGYPVEGSRWFRQVIERAGGTPSRELADCLAGLANLLIVQGDPEQAGDVARRGVEMALDLGENEVAAFALGVLGTSQQHRGDDDAAHHTFEAALELQRRLNNPGRLTRAMGNLAGNEEERGNFDRAEALMRESLGILDEIGDMHEAAVQRQNLAFLLAISGRAPEARELAGSLVGTVVQLSSPTLTLAFANTYLNVLLRVGEPAAAARLFGAEEAMRERNSMPNPWLDEDVAEIRGLLQGQMSEAEWDRLRRQGRAETVEDVLAGLR